MIQSSLEINSLKKLELWYLLQRILFSNHWQLFSKLTLYCSECLLFLLYFHSLSLILLCVPECWHLWTVSLFTFALWFPSGFDLRGWGGISWREIENEGSERIYSLDSLSPRSYGIKCISYWRPNPVRRPSLNNFHCLGSGNCFLFLLI